MGLEFFIGNNDKKIAAERSETNTASHYAWCLDELMSVLSFTRNEEAKMEALLEFRYNMNQSPGTKKMLNKMEDIFSEFVHSKPLPGADDIIDLLSSMPVEDSQQYMTVAFKK